MYRGDKNKPPLKVRKLAIFLGSEGGFYFFPKSILRKSPWVFIFFQIPQKKFGGVLFFPNSKFTKKSVLSVFALVYPKNFPARLRRAFFVQFRLGTRAIPPFFSGAPSARFFIRFRLGIPLKNRILPPPFASENCLFTPPWPPKTAFSPPRPPVGRGRVKSLF